MDYVLFGMGYGATLMLLGWALRTFGPERKYRNIDPQDIEREVEQRRWVRFIQGLGGVIAIGGTAMVLFTFIVMLINPDDVTGRQISLAVWAFLAVGVLIWCWMYVSRYGVLGIWSRETGYGFRTSQMKSARPSSLSSSSTARVTPKPRISTPRESPHTTPVLEGPSLQDDAAIDAPAEPELAVSDEAQPAEVAASETFDDPLTGDESEPGYDFGDGSDTTVPAEVSGRSEALMRLRRRQSRMRETQE